MPNFTWSDHIQELVDAGVLKPHSHLKGRAKDGKAEVFTVDGRLYRNHIDGFDSIEHAIIKRLLEAGYAVWGSAVVTMRRFDWEENRWVCGTVWPETESDTLSEALHAALPLLRKANHER